MWETHHHQSGVQSEVLGVNVVDYGKAEFSLVGEENGEEIVFLSGICSEVILWYSVDNLEREELQPLNHLSH